MGQERVLAARVIQLLNGEFGGRVQSEVVLWEHEPTRATMSFQEQIEPPSAMDIIVCILWSRIGTRLPQGFERRPDGTPYESGTAFEFEDAKRAHDAHGKPDLLVYRKTAEPLVSLRHADRLRQQQEQWETLELYLHKWFFHEDGSFKAGYTQFETADEFEQKLEHHLRRLIRDKVRDIHVASAARTMTWHRGSPFRGLEVFEFDHAQVFFGCTRAIGEIRQALVRQSAAGSAFVLVVGMSGSGKSSLIRAGVLPTLTHPGVIEGVGLWRWGIFRPSNAPADLLRGIAQLLLDNKVLPELATAGANIEALAAAFKSAPQQAVLPIRMGLTRAAEALAHHERLTAPPEARLVLVIDQMEELFTLDGLTQSDREGFIALLAALAGSGVVWVIGTMRSDFCHRTAELPALVALAEGFGQYHLLPPRQAEMGQMLREPAHAAGLTFEEDPVTRVGLDAIIEEATTQNPEVLPLLEFTLDELFKQRNERGVLTMAAYHQLGGLEGALGQRAEAAFQALSEAEKTAVPGVLRALVTMPQSGDSWMSARTIPMSVFPEESPSRAMVEAFLRPEARLFVADGDGEGTRVRVAHEAVFSAWERAREIILADREFIHTRQRVEIAAARWEEEDRSEDLLLPLGKPLAEAEDVLSQRREELSPEVVTYIETSSTVQREKERLTQEAAEKEANTAHFLARRRKTVSRAREFAWACLALLLVGHVGPGKQYWRPIRDSVFDTYQRIFPRQVERFPAIIVAIDDDSLAGLGQWPWPRSLLAKLIEKTHDLGALAVGLNLLMPEADRLSPSVFIADRPDVSPELREALSKLPSNDAILAETLRRVPSVVGRVGHDESGEEVTPSAGQTPVSEEGGGTAVPYVTTYAGHLLNVPPLEEAAWGRAYLNLTPDPDGVVRLVPLLVAVQGTLAPTLALELLRVAMGANWHRVHTGPHGVSGVQIGPGFYPTDLDGRIRLYYSQAKPQRRISALTIMNGAADADMVRNHVALIGITATGTHGVAATPVDARMDGVELHAQLIENMLTGNRLVRPVVAPRLELLVSLLSGLMVLFLLPKLRLSAQYTAIIVMSALLCVVSVFFFVQAHVLLDPSFASFTTIVVYLISIAGGNPFELRQFLRRSSQ